MTHLYINSDLNWNLIETFKSKFLGLIYKLDFAARLHQSLNIPLGPQFDSSDLGTRHMRALLGEPVVR